MPSHQIRVRQFNCTHQLDRNGDCIFCGKHYIMHYPTKVAYINSEDPTTYKSVNPYQDQQEEPSQE